VGGNWEMKAYHMNDTHWNIKLTIDYPGGGGKQFFFKNTHFALKKTYDVKILYFAKMGNIKLFVDGSLKEEEQFDTHQKMRLASSWVGCTCSLDYCDKFLGSVTNFTIVPAKHPSIFQVTSGDCRVKGGCVTSPNYPRYYDDNQACTISSSGSWEVVKFNTEHRYDILTVNGVEYSGENGPSGVIPSGNIQWYSDYSEIGVGWKLCQGPTPAPTPEPTPEPTPVPTPQPTLVLTSAENNVGAEIRFTQPTEYVNKYYPEQPWYIRHLGCGTYFHNRRNEGAAFVADSSFIVRKGLAGHGSISFESKNKPNFFLRHSGYKIKLDKKIETSLFKKDASWYETESLTHSDGFKSYMSFNYKDYYLREKKYRIWIAKEEAGEEFRRKASWKLVSYGGHH